MKDRDRIPFPPMTEMQAAAAQLHELYSSFRGAGFTRYEALYLTAQVLTNSSNSSEG